MNGNSFPDMSFPDETLAESYEKWSLSRDVREGDRRRREEELQE
jgi:hypothetical protein